MGKMAIQSSNDHNPKKKKLISPSPYIPITELNKEVKKKKKKKNMHGMGEGKLRISKKRNQNP